MGSVGFGLNSRQYIVYILYGAVLQGLVKVGLFKEIVDATASSYILDNSVLPTLWQKFGEASPVST